MLFNKKKVFYWAPCLNKVGTVISTKNSAIGLAYYKRDFYDVYLINVCGEWDDYLEEIKKYDIKIISLSFSYYKFLPKTGFFSSRFSYILIFLISLFPLIKCLNRYKPDFFIMHLITSLPLFIMRFLNLETKFILRISGLPKLNFLRKFWKKSSKKII